MKKFLIAFFVLMAACSVHAVSLNIPPEIPSNVNWSFWIEFDSLNFSEAKLLLDNSEIAAFSTYNNTLDIRGGSINNGSVHSIAVSGNKAFVSMRGLSEGTHTIAISDASTTVLAFKPVDTAYKSQVDTSINSLQETIDFIASEITALKTNIAGLRTNIEELNSKISSVESSTNGFDSRISEVKTETSTLQEKILNMDGEINTLLADITKLNEAALEQQKKQNEQKSVLDNLLGVFGNSWAAEPETGSEEAVLQEKNEQSIDSNASIAGGTGFVAFAGTSAVMWGLLIIIIAFVALIGIKVASDKGIGFKRNSDVYEASAPSARDLHESIEAERSGKWAFENTARPEPREKEKSRFQLGDLIKKKE